MSDKKFRLDVLKAKYQIVKDKMLLFSAGFGGSIVMMVKLYESSLYVELFFGLGLILSFIGVLKNIFLANKLYLEIKGLENE